MTIYGTEEQHRKFPGFYTLLEEDMCYKEKTTKTLNNKREGLESEKISKIVLEKVILES